MIRRWMYGERFTEFLKRSDEEILGALAKDSVGNIELTQRNAWASQISIIRGIAIPNGLMEEARVYFELSVPRLGRRVDVAMLIGHVLFIFEFKVGESTFPRTALDQAWDYGLDFKNFHATSHEINVLPVLIATEASDRQIQISSKNNDGLGDPLCASPNQISDVIVLGLTYFSGPQIDADVWERGRYLPTPTIVEAARALYAGHTVEEISRSDAGAKNLSETTRTIDAIIEKTMASGGKAICFVTGVPGAGKTLVGLDIANRHKDATNATHSVFLSGNGPLVAVLREALTRDRVERSEYVGEKLRKGQARQAVEKFVQNVHHFRDECLRDDEPPLEHVVLFDEAQRAWNLEKTSDFMKKKKGLGGFSQSEPEFLISCLDRHKDWAVVVCLVGGGQEINTGEGGIGEWMKAVLDRFSSWSVYLSPRLSDTEYQSAEVLQRILALPNTNQEAGLHLHTSMRSFRAESLSQLVKNILDIEVEAAQNTLRSLDGKYPIVLTRSVSAAKRWLREMARGGERYGMVVSSQAERLKC